MRLAAQALQPLAGASEIAGLIEQPAAERQHLISSPITSADGTWALTAKAFARARAAAMSLAPAGGRDDARLRLMTASSTSGETAANASPAASSMRPR
jgi:hypothetical protein